jgi:hypothetical protein
VCLALLSAALLLEQGFTLVWGAANTIITGAFASFFAAQLYLVAGIRKVRSRHFMNGRVILDNIAYNAYQAAAGNQDSYRYHACLLSRSCCAAKPFSSPAAPPRC